MSVGDLAHPLLSRLRHLAVAELEDLRPLHQEEEGDDEDREQLDEAREDADGDVLQRAGRVVELARQLVDLVLELVGDVVAVVVLAELVVVAQVVDVAGQVLGEVLDAVDHRRHEQQPDAEDGEARSRDRRAGSRAPGEPAAHASQLTAGATASARNTAISSSPITERTW